MTWSIIQSSHWVNKDKKVKAGAAMNLLHWSYMKRHQVKALYDTFPNSPVIFRKIKSYYFIYYVEWSPLDQPVHTPDLEAMELLLNREFNHEDNYLGRKNELTDYS